MVSKYILSLSLLYLTNLFTLLQGHRTCTNVKYFFWRETLYDVKKINKRMLAVTDVLLALEIKDHGKHFT